jgi:hypothetical protein
MERSSILMTLATDPKLRSGSIQEEAKFLKVRGWLWYPINGEPSQRIDGAWLYFVRDGYVVGRKDNQGSPYRWQHRVREDLHRGRDPQAGMASKDQVTHAESQEPLPIGMLGINRGSRIFVTPRGSKTRSALQTCSSAAYRYNH